MRSGQAAHAILQACWKETLDPGPYKFSGAPDWSKVLACDLIYATLMVRAATHGNVEELDLQCPACRKKFVWDLPIDQLPVYPLPPESVAKIAAGDNLFTATLSNGAVAQFRLLDGAAQLKAVESVQECGNEIMLAALTTRVISIEGVDQTKLGDYIAHLSMHEAQLFIDAFDEVDGGVETLFDVYCPKCGHEWEVDLPLDLQRMFSPKRRARRRKKEGTTLHAGPGLETPPV